MVQDACYYTRVTGLEWGFPVEIRNKTLHPAGKLYSGGKAHILAGRDLDAFFHTHPSGLCHPSESDIETCMEDSIGYILVGTVDGKIGVFNVPYGKPVMMARV